MLRRARVIFAVGVSAVAVAGACSSEQSSSTIDPNSGPGGSGGTNTGGVNAGGGSASPGTGGSSGSLGGSSGTIGAGGSAGTGLFDACAATEETADAEPIDMYIMLDTTTSLVQNGDLWTPLKSAVKNFVNLPESAGIRVGLQYFGLPISPGVMSCNPADYATPAVPIAELPGNAAALVASIDAARPDALTATRPALEGALTYAHSWALQNPDRLTVVVLATDGYPTVCDTNLTAMNDLAAQYANGTPRILTFVVGIGAVPNLNNLARSGGTGQAFLLDAGANVEADFAQAMRSIASTPLSCSFEIPRAEDGGTNLSLINVAFTAPLSPSEVVYKVDGVGDCTPGTKAWYFDSNTNPQRIVLCPDTCDNLGAGRIQIFVGCASEPPPT